jgi:tripartite-type tricarboxylate transporter receptor subunit TctC
MDVFWDRSRQRGGAAHVLCAVLIAFLGCAPSIAAPDEFYAGKTITILTSGGGAYETYGRTFARYMPKYIPGHPAMIVQAMPGAGGARAASYLYRVAARDGTIIGGLHGAVLTAPFLNPRAADFDVTRFSWIGNATRDKYVGYVWHTSPVQSLEDAKTRQLIVGGTSVGGNGIDMAADMTVRPSEYPCLGVLRMQLPDNATRVPQDPQHRPAEDQVEALLLTTLRGGDSNSA